MAAEHQHYVPQLLLRGFLSRDPTKAAKEQVHVFDLNEGKPPFTTSIANIMGERRFNDFLVDEETLATVEPATGKIEAHLAPTIERIRREKRLHRSPQEFGDLAFLMAFQFIRTKKIRELPLRLDRQIRAKIEGMGLDPAKVDGLINWDEETLKREHVRHQLDDGIKKYAEIIAEKEFFIMVAPEGTSFYVGDHPVVLHNDEPRRGMFGGGLGLAVPYIQIYLPLSADVMLCAYDPAVLGQLMKNRDEGERDVQLYALDKLRRGLITPAQMKESLEGLRAGDDTSRLIDAIRAGEPVAIGPEQVQCYNSLQAFHAHRFVIDPDDKFIVAKEMIAERKGAKV